MKHTITTILTVLMATVMSTFITSAQEPQEGRQQRMYSRSKTIEKERPQLNEVTKNLIAAYRRNPSDANYEALREQVGINYDKVLARKKAKLEELRQTARDQHLVDEMQEIVDEMIRDRQRRIDDSMARFSDSRMRPGARTPAGGFLPLLGAGENLYVAYTPVTNAEYALFDSSFRYEPGKERHPVVNVSYDDAVSYCAWKSIKDGVTYRLPTEHEWELAAGHMPKDADFNCGISEGTTPVEAFNKTTGASGGIDFWGNCWEWTSSEAGEGEFAVKGGAFDSPRTACRTENRGNGRDRTSIHANVGFRLVKEM